MPYTTKSYSNNKVKQEKLAPAPEFFEACRTMQQALVCHLMFVRAYELKGEDGDDPYRLVTFSFKDEASGTWWKLKAWLRNRQAIENGGILERFANESWCPVLFDPTSVERKPGKDGREDDLLVRKVYVTLNGGPQLSIHEDMEDPFPPDYIEELVVQERERTRAAALQRAGEEDSQIYDI